MNQPANGYDIVVTVLQNGVLYGSTLTIPSVRLVLLRGGRA